MDIGEMLLAGISVLSLIVVCALVAKLHHKPSCVESGGRLVYVGDTENKTVCVFDGNSVPGIK